MAEVKYLLTIDEETQELIKVELMDADGGLTEIPLEDLPRRKKGHGGDNYTVNIFLGGGQAKTSTYSDDSHPHEKAYFPDILPPRNPY